MNEKLRLFFNIYRHPIYSLSTCMNKLNLGNNSGGFGYLIKNNKDFNLLCDGYKTYYDLNHMGWI